MNYDTHSENQIIMQSLTQEELDQVAGGAILLWAAGAVAVCGAINAAESVGEKLGKALYYAMN